ncbi:hypothetical protein ES705_42246 [subsurface metagenome]
MLENFNLKGNEGRYLKSKPLNNGDKIYDDINYINTYL